MKFDEVLQMLSTYLANNPVVEGKRAEQYLTYKQGYRDAVEQLYGIVSTLKDTYGDKEG